MVSFTLVVFAALAASIADASPIPSSNSGPATTTEAGLLPVYTPPGSPVRSKTSEIHNTCEDPGDRAVDGTGLAHLDKDGTPASKTSRVLNTARCEQDRPPHPSASGLARLPQPRSATVSALNSLVDHQQVMKDRDPDAAPASESAAHYRQFRTSHGLDADDSDKIETGKSGSGSESTAHYRQYRTSHGLDADDSDKIETGKSEEYDNAGETSEDLGQ